MLSLRWNIDYDSMVHLLHLKHYKINKKERKTIRKKDRDEYVLIFIHYLRAREYVYSCFHRYSLILLRLITFNIHMPDGIFFAKPL